MKEPKQTIVWRKDLKCRKGKFAAQIAHASMKVFFDRMEETEIAWDDEPQDGYVFSVTPDMKQWIEGIFTKVVLGCQSEEEILLLEAKCKALNIPYAVITDAGKTEFHGVPTITCIALGPYKAEVLEELTKDFSLM